MPFAAEAPLPAARPRPAGRLLLQRLRKSQSTTVLYGEPEHALEQLSLGDGPGSSFFPQMDGGPTQVRLRLCMAGGCAWWLAACRCSPAQLCCRAGVNCGWVTG